jgi:hypothetical protein
MEKYVNPLTIESNTEKPVILAGNKIVVKIGKHEIPAQLDQTTRTVEPIEE